MLGANIFVAEENEVLYVSVTVLLHKADTLSKIDFIAYEFWFLIIKPETSFPEIKAGGTPGPGTVNWPVKNKLSTFLLFKLGLRNAVCNNVCAIP